MRQAVRIKIKVTACLIVRIFLCNLWNLKINAYIKIEGWFVLFWDIAFVWDFISFQQQQRTNTRPLLCVTLLNLLWASWMARWDNSHLSRPTKTTVVWWPQSSGLNAEPLLSPTPKKLIHLMAIQWAFHSVNEIKLDWSDIVPPKFRYISNLYIG